MAKRTRKRRKTGRKKAQKINKLLISFGILACLALVITANTLAPFSDTLPGWNSLYRQVVDYIEEASAPVSFVDGEATVHYIDVGQGSSVLIKTPGGAALLDAGENDRGDLVVAYLREQGVERLDYLLASHPHSDHIGGMDTVLDEIPVDKVIMPDLKDSLIPTTRTYEDFLDALERSGAELAAANMGDSYPLGSGTLTIVGPAGDFNDLNNMSAGARFQYGARSFLFTGDMEEQAEKNLAESDLVLRSDVFCMGHHGSKTSNTQALLERVRPSYFVIQCGYGNTYGHPDKQALARAEVVSDQIYRSDLHGTVVFATDGQELTVQTEK